MKAFGAIVNQVMNAAAGFRDIADFDFSLPEFLMRPHQEIFQKPLPIVLLLVLFWH